ncbi:hypothetical protein [Bacillus sp. MUM 13]|uniref:hypothetical protein n=1 Tax=Bacillus sp. MUM 13 TaxID=1678001 RepID=UPI00147A15A4|nr:hypothetical protein [Bacillus sp. MUM 13]
MLFIENAYGKFNKDAGILTMGIEYILHEKSGGKNGEKEKKEKEKKYRDIKRHIEI